MEAFSPTTINTGKGTEFEGAIVALFAPERRAANVVEKCVRFLVSTDSVYVKTLPIFLCQTFLPAVLVCNGP